MDIQTVHKFEYAIISFFNIDGWQLEWCGGKYEHYDAKGFTSKGYPCVMEIKLRNKWYQEKLIEKYKYDKLMSLPEDVVKLYYVADPKGWYLFWLNDIEQKKEEKLYCPKTTLWNNNKREKAVYLLDENLAHLKNIY